MEDVEAAAALYAAFQLEELGVLQVCDRLVELHHRGGLPIAGIGPAAALLDAYWLGRAERMPAEERRELYARTVGPSCDHLLGRLAASITDHDAAGRAADIAWSADELRSSIDAHIDEPARTAIPILHAQLGDALAILSDSEVLTAYGSRDSWHLIDHLSRLELGGTRDVVRRQALAATGTILLAWLGEHGAPVTEEIADAAEGFLTAAAMPPTSGY
jgi:hypothetical protein